VQNIKKITSAMKMVAASKMRKAQAAQEQCMGMPVSFLKLFGEPTGTNLYLNCHVSISITRYYRIRMCELKSD
jgi:hypothetical protein